MKKDNRGFSLIEVLVAIMILAIIVAPFLSSFLRATKINARSRKMLRATTVAENIMEGLSGFLIEDISKQFGGIYNLREIVDDDGKHLDWESDFLILNNSAGDETIIPEELGPNKSVVTEVGGVPVDRGERVFTQKSDNNVYEYLLRNVTEDKQKFDVKVTIDANKYRNEEAKETNPDDYNKYYNIAAGQMFNVAEMNPKTDVVWAEPLEMSLRYADDFIYELNKDIDKINNTQIDPTESEQRKEIIKQELKTRKEADEWLINKIRSESNFLSKCVRTYQIIFEEDAIFVAINIDYHYNKDGIAETRSYLIRSTEKYFPKVMGTQKEDLKNIYLCYYPNYDLIKDVVQILHISNFAKLANGIFDTSFDKHYNIYVIKQEADALSNYNEKNYKVDFNIYTSGNMLEKFLPEMADYYKAQYGEDILRKVSYPFTIRGNLGHYFEKDNPAPGEPQGLIEDQVTFKVAHGDGVYTSSWEIDEKDLESMDIIDYVIRYAGVDKSTKNLIYFTTIDVYEEGGITVADDGSYTIDDSKHIAKMDSDQPWVTE